MQGTLRRALLGAAGLAIIALGGCQLAGTEEDPQAGPAVLVPATATTNKLEDLPPPDRKVDIAVYDLPDETGKLERTDTFTTFSRPVTQGGASIVIDVLKRVGGGTWFTVVERQSLQNLVQERNIIETQRRVYAGRPEGTPPTLPPLRFAGVILEGGITDYDTNETTGGVGARFLGVGGDTKYRRDMVTVSLRLVSVTSGEVLASTATTKTVYSMGVQGQHFRFVAVDEIFEFEAGITRNEPTSLAVRQAIELAVYSLIMEGIRKGVWNFADHVRGTELLAQFDESYDKS